VRVHIIEHESFEAAAAIEIWAQARGHQVSLTLCYLGDKVPKQPDFDFLVVMGGPQSPATTPQESPHFDGQAELSLIRAASDSGKRVLGVCLGAQMIGDALGGHFEHSPEREIGVFPVTLIKSGVSDPNFQDFPTTFKVGHWHGDMPGLTPGAEVLATSAGCPRQIIRYSPKVYGFQCHFELTPDAVESLIQASGSELETHRDRPYVEQPSALRAHDYSAMNELLFKFLDRFTA